MIKFYLEFPDFKKVATLSQQLTWSHFVEILPIQDELKRNFYAAMRMHKSVFNFYRYAILVLVVNLF